MDNVFHDGEKRVQQLAGRAMNPASASRMISRSIIGGAINFIEKQPMFVASTVDNNQNVWTSLLIGDYGFVKVPSPEGISINTDMIYSDKEDVLFDNISNGSEMGTLFIELSSRRRFRINGTTSINGGQIDLSVVESYANCPQYIQQRVISKPASFGQVAGNKLHGNELTEELKQWVSNADTLFVGTQSAGGRMDASHRGGAPGFIEVIDSNTLKIPDYKGNNLFNTFGNMMENANAGLLLVDFDNKSTLQLTGKSELLFDQNSPEDLKKTMGTGRYWLFSMSEFIVTKQHHDVNWEFLSYSPYNPEL